MEKLITELYACFRRFNKHFFENKLPEPYITVQTAGKSLNTLGWCSLAEWWRDKEDEQKRFEINITAENLHRPVVNILQTLLHEMVHLHNVINDIKDCSRGGSYHNKRFKETCEQFGLMYPHEKPDKKIGFSAVVVTEDTKKLIESWEIDQKAFSLARSVPLSMKKQSNSHKLECPGCGLKVRATKPDVQVKCMDCDLEMEEA